MILSMIIPSNPQQPYVDRSKIFFPHEIEARWMGWFHDVYNGKSQNDMDENQDGKSWKIMAENRENP